MRDHRACSTTLRWSAALLSTVLLPAPVLAQYAARPVARAAPAPFAGWKETPAAALSRNLRLLASSPRDFNALMAAGRAALDLGDTQTAVGFFGRAEEVRPSDAAPKIGMGAASAALGEPATALDWFGQAQRLGASAAALGADRGLANDLLGRQAAAQSDYRAALSGPDAIEARRRLALSLAISRDTSGAIATLQPLLNQRDPAAQRARAFILALGGDRAGARTAIDRAMPGSAGRIDPFFMVLPSLSPEQKAAAVHLGVFPTASEIRLVAAPPVKVASNSVPLPRPVPVEVRRGPDVARPAPITGNSRFAPRSASPVKLPVGQRTMATITPMIMPPVLRPTPIAAPPVSQPITKAPPPTAPAVVAMPRVEAPRDEAPVAPLAKVEAQPVAAAGSAAPGFTSSSEVILPPSATAELVGDRLSGIDKLLAATEELPLPVADSDDAAEARMPAAPDKATEARKIAASNKAAKAKKAAEAKKIADVRLAAEAKKAAEEKKQRESIGVAGTNWVQLAGGSRSDAMAREFRKLSAKSSALRKRGGAVTHGKEYYRLLVGPFDSKSAAQGFVNTLAKDGVDGFSWTRTPAAIKIEKLPSK